MSAKYQIDSCVATSPRSKGLGFYASGCYFVRETVGVHALSKGFKNHQEAEEWCKEKGYEFLPHWSAEVLKNM